MADCEIELPAVSWNDARKRVIKSYRDWLRAVRLTLPPLPSFSPPLSPSLDPAVYSPPFLMPQSLTVIPSQSRKILKNQLNANVCASVQAPEIQSMYGINYPVSAIRTKIRQQFERHRYVNDLSVTDVLISKSHQEFQVGPFHLDPPTSLGSLGCRWAMAMKEPGASH